MVGLQQAEVQGVRRLPEARMIFLARARSADRAGLQGMAEIMLRDLAFVYQAARSVRQSLSK
jgi:hypothetical protein